MPIITVHVYPPPTDAAKVLPMKFENENEDKNFVMAIYCRYYRNSYVYGILITVLKLYIYIGATCQRYTWLHTVKLSLAAITS